MKKIYLLIFVCYLALAQTIDLKKDWNLIGATEDTNSFKFVDKECIELIYGYDKEKWLSYPNSSNNNKLLNMEKGLGFWMYAKKACNTDTAQSFIKKNIVDISKFYTNATNSIKEIDCTLSNGTQSTCYEIDIKGFPADRDELGSFCPRTTTTTASSAGKWFDNGILYDLTGKFITNLSTFYKNNNWKLYDDVSGDVKITNTQTSCEAAARPDVDIKYQNFCVECNISYYSKAPKSGISKKYVIPKTPIPSNNPISIGRGGVGVALNGVELAAPAPINAILGAYTIAAFDDCVGHVNPFEGYHYHGANHGDESCPSINFDSDGHGGIFAYALDGYAIHGMLNKNNIEPSDLDNCRGHTDDIRGYHYHTASAGENTFIGCFKGETVKMERPQRPPPR